METETRKAVAGSDILAFAEGTPLDLTGAGPMVRFTLDDGTELDVTHEGDHIVVRNRGTTLSSALALVCRSGNTIALSGA